VQQRVHADGQVAGGSTTPDAASSAMIRFGTLPPASSSSSTPVPTLCAADEQLVRSLFTQLQQWPDTMQQLWTAISTRKLTDQMAQLRQQAAVHDYVRDIALRHQPRIGCETSHPDRADTAQASVGVGSTMDEMVFSVALRHLIRGAPGLSMLHVPPQLSVAWHMGAGSPTSSDPMVEWLKEHRAQLLGVRYLVVHWCSEHFCSILIDLHVWRAGPHVRPSAAAPVETQQQQHVESRSCAATLAALAPASRSSSSLPSLPYVAASEENQQELGEVTVAAMGRGKRRRQVSRALQAAQQDPRSMCDAPVPLLHLDSLPSACFFMADKRALLRRLCIALNTLCGTAWPVRLQRDLDALVHLCGPVEQLDEWSCGYRLLCAWDHLFHAMRSSPSLPIPDPQQLTPAAVNRASGDVFAHPFPSVSPSASSPLSLSLPSSSLSSHGDAVLVQRVQAWWAASNMNAAEAVVQVCPISHPKATALTLLARQPRLDPSLLE